MAMTSTALDGRRLTASNAYLSRATILQYALEFVVVRCPLLYNTILADKNLSSDLVSEERSIRIRKEW